MGMGGLIKREGIERLEPGSRGETKKGRGKLFELFLIRTKKIARQSEGGSKGMRNFFKT